jgi:hypothetical protein
MFRSSRSDEDRCHAHPKSSSAHSDRRHHRCRSPRHRHMACNDRRRLEGGLQEHFRMSIDQNRTAPRETNERLLLCRLPRRTRAEGREQIRPPRLRCHLPSHRSRHHVDIAPQPRFISAHRQNSRQHRTATLLIGKPCGGSSPISGRRRRPPGEGASPPALGGVGGDRVHDAAGQANLVVMRLDHARAPAHLARAALHQQLAPICDAVISLITAAGMLAGRIKIEHLRPSDDGAATYRYAREHRLATASGQAKQSAARPGFGNLSPPLNIDLNDIDNPRPVLNPSTGSALSSSRPRHRRPQRVGISGWRLSIPLALDPVRAVTYALDRSVRGRYDDPKKRFHDRRPARSPRSGRRIHLATTYRGAACSAATCMG